jgi:putative SOS response-associated peptidase YedK
MKKGNGRVKERGHSCPLGAYVSPKMPTGMSALRKKRVAPPVGAPLRTCTIVTVIPNALIASIHDRMPAILRPEHEAGGRDSTVSDAAELTRSFDSPRWVA